jgi:predicted ATPase/DNA-binding SARP family transcriptional activator
MDGAPAIEGAGAVRRGAAIGIRVGVLGPMWIEVDGIEHAITGRRPRAVLASLVLHLGEPVSADRLLEEVWGDDQPDTGVKAVAYQISRLRSLMEPERVGEGSVIITTSAGYVLDVEPDRVDLYEFDRLVDLAREALPTDANAARALVEQALRLRRGRPFADLDADFVAVESRRLEARHLLARRTLAECRIAQGEAIDVIGDLEAMAAELPLDESVAELLMSALHRSGRTADGLRVYGDFRKRLGSELGIEPSGQLRRLEQQLLAGDRPLGSSDDHRSSRDTTVGRWGNLPTPLSSFVGRTDEIREISELLSDNRLVSLLSFGGVGKTRLAIEVASSLSDHFVDGVWFVDLVPIAESVLLPETFIAGVGLAPPGGRDPEAYLVSQLATRRALIVVDNCEHLVDDVGPLVERLVLAAPDIRVLATSRLALGVRDEVIWHVQPLELATAAFELFTQRGRLARPGFRVDGSNRASVDRICERVDGIPLAIELASARLKTMTVEQIADHLEDSFRLLTRADRKADGRQHSLLATMAWSHELLDGADREMLRRLSAFTGGFTLDAATVIGTDSSRSSVEVLDTLGRLVDTGLIAFVEAGGEARYRMLETVRDFAAGHLDRDERYQLELSHATYYSRIAARIAESRFDDHEASIRLGDQELGNLRAAIAWAFANDQARLGMSIASSLWRYFWEQPSGGNENVRWGRTALDLISDDDDDVLLVAAGTVIEAYNLGDRDAERNAAERVRRGLGTVRDPIVRSRLLAALATSVLDSDPRAAEALLDEAWTTSPLRPQSIDILNNYVELSWLSGTLDDGAAILERLGDVLGLLSQPPPTAIKIEAGVAACSGRWEDVVRVTEPTRELDEWLNDLSLLRSEALGALGRYDDALAGVRPPEKDGYLVDLQRSQLVCAAIDLARGDAGAAFDRLTMVADMISDDERRLAISMHIASLAAVTATQLGQHETAAIMFGFAAAEQQRLDISLRPSNRSLVESATAACREALGAARFDAIAADGASTEWRKLPLVDRPRSTSAE